MPYICLHYYSSKVCAAKSQLKLLLDRLWKKDAVCLLESELHPVILQDVSDSNDRNYFIKFVAKILKSSAKNKKFDCISKLRKVQQIFTQMKFYSFDINYIKNTLLHNINKCAPKYLMNWLLDRIWKNM